jgi:hypothetical protein
MTKPFQPPRPRPMAPAAAEQMPTHRESDDNYRGVAATLADDLRVIQCRNALQYIAQHRYAGGLRGVEWRSICYCASKKSLIRACEGLQSRSGPVSTAALAALPERARAWRKN